MTEEDLSLLPQCGFKVALDDLGASSSSLDLLSSLRPDFVKLDANVVRDVDRDPYRVMIAARLLKLAKDLGVTIVGEGVESEEQWLWLVAHAADFVQGFFGRPASPRPCLLPSTHRRAGETFQTHLA